LDATARGERLFLPLRVASVYSCHCAWRAFILATARGERLFLPLRVAAARNRFDWFPAPSCEQALRPAPIMDVVGFPQAYGHASAAINQRLLALVRLFLGLNECRWRSNPR
jgi:hypothetical protein